MPLPTIKMIGNVSVSVDEAGHPHWTRISGQNVNWTLGHEELRDLHYATGRIVAFLDETEKKDPK